MDWDNDSRRTTLANDDYESASLPTRRDARPPQDDEIRKPEGYESTCLLRRQGPKTSRRVDFGEIEIRRGGSGAGPGSIVGYGALFNSASLPMGKGSNRFVEKVAPTAFSRAIKAGADIRALWDHDTSGLLGRTTSGTLKVNEDPRGLAFSCQLPDTQVGWDAAESIRRGDVNGMSFGFRCVQDQWSKDADGGSVRTLLDVDPFDISPTAFPAYEGTSVRLIGAGSSGGIRSTDALDNHRRLLELHERLLSPDGLGPVADMSARRRRLEELEGRRGGNLNNHRRRLMLAMTR